MPDAVVFMSDAHLGAAPAHAERERVARLHRFFESLPDRAGRLVIVGDLFDFWFEYRTAIPRRAFSTLAALERLRAAGVAVDYLNGNHDFWLGPFLEQEVGVRTVDGALTLERDGRRLWVHHGDGLIGGDAGYRWLKRVIRHPASIAAYRWLHPDLGIPLARSVSHWSRDSRPDPPFDGERLWREIAVPRFDEGWDAVLIGHFHHAWERREKGREFFLLGDWMTRFTYVVFEGGRLGMRTWEG
jgi:UDP-2,3-diacylglucosamine hydrolase